MHISVVHKWLKLSTLPLAAFLITACGSGSSPDNAPALTDTASGKAVPVRTGILFTKDTIATSGCRICRATAGYSSALPDSLYTRSYVSPRYTIMITGNRNAVGEHFLVCPTRQQGDSIYLSPDQDSSFSIREDADWFHGLYDQYLFIDNGTGTQNRTVKVYDLASEKKIFEQQYFDGEPEYDGQHLFFWVRSALKPAVQCPEAVKKYGSQTIVAEKLQTDLQTLQQVHTKQYDCRMEE